MAEAPAARKAQLTLDGEHDKLPQNSSASNPALVGVDVALAALRDCISYPSLHSLAVKAWHQFRELAQTSELHLLPMPVRGLPSGTEVGKFICIDLGGTNLRVSFVELLGKGGSNASPKPDQYDGDNKKPSPRFLKTHEKSWPIEDHLKMDKAEDLFAWVGACVANVIRSGYQELSAAEREELIIGITFSFPMTQTLLEEATLLPMGKGFAITSNLNLGKMLLAGYQRQCDTVGINATSSEDNAKAQSPELPTLGPLPKLKLTAIANDTISTFISVAYAVRAQSNRRTVMGLIVGTGTNAAIPLKMDHFPMSKIIHSNSKCIGNVFEANKIVTNTEWSVRPTGDALFELNIPTKWDKQLDKQLPHGVQGFQPLEYMTAGRYLGEIVRLVLCEMALHSTPSNEVPPPLSFHNSVTSAAVASAAMTADVTALVEPFVHLPAHLKEVVHPICKAVMDRSAALIAAYAVGLLALAGDVTVEGEADDLAKGAAGDEESLEELVIAYTGSLMSSNPDYRDSIAFWINKIIQNSSTTNKRKRVVLIEALDGGVIGAAVLAASASVTQTKPTQSFASSEGSLA